MAPPRSGSTTILALACLLAAPAAEGQVTPPGAFVPVEVTLTTPTGTLVGTLLTPSGTTRMPVVLIHPGSGPTDRDGNSRLLPGKNNSLKLLAEGLAARGVASLRIDKRGIAGSAAALTSEAEIRFDTYIDDAEAWLHWLRAGPRFTRIVVVGHSEGALIGAVAASRLPADGYVSLSGAGARASVVLRRQLAGKLPPELAAENERILTALELNTPVGQVPGPLWTLYRPGIQPYLASWFAYDPAEIVHALGMPVLLLNGSTDFQVDTSDFAALASARPDAERRWIPGMNHVLKLVGGDFAAQLPSYSDPTLPVAPDVIEVLAGFVLKLPAPSR